VKVLLFFISLAVATVPGRPLTAQQLAVRVVAEDGSPIANASVELWVQARRVLTLSTRQDGYAFAQRSKKSAFTSVSARAIGYRPASVPLGGREAIEVRLAAVVPRIPDIVVEALPRYDCREDEPAARGVWQAATTRYSLLPVERRYWAVGRGAQETAILSKVSSPESWDTTRWGVSGQARAQTSQFIHDSGYAIRRKPGRSTGLIATSGGGPWWYPRLHTWNADHFARPEFGQLNALYTISSGPTGWTIGFCTKRTTRPGIAGLMRIDSTYAFTRVEWQFQTGKPKEDAGGEIVFLTGTTSALLPLVSYFWKLAGGSEDDEPLYYREAFMSDQWTINLDDPRRSNPDTGLLH
jgi:hypothetical protein